MRHYGARAGRANWDCISSSYVRTSEHMRVRMYNIHATHDYCSSVGLEECWILGWGMICDALVHGCMCACARLVQRLDNMSREEEERQMRVRKLEEKQEAIQQVLERREQQVS